MDFRSCIRGVLGGSGGDAMTHVCTFDAVMALVGKPAADIRVVYLGTATYDSIETQAKMTNLYRTAGCLVFPLDVTEARPSDSQVAELARADVILVSGGNTLFAVDRWVHLGLDAHLRAAASRGVVLAGGSAGLIWLFDAGHSDSADPASFRVKREGDTSWPYIRVPALGLLPGLSCPHHDRVQSNGVLRAIDFDAMMLRHPGEVGVAVDHWATLILDRGRYRVAAIPGMAGSVAADGSFAVGAGSPGVWLKRVVQGAVQCVLLPREGAVSDFAVVATDIVADPRVAACRADNPSQY